MENKTITVDIISINKCERTTIECNANDNISILSMDLFFIARQGQQFTPYYMSNFNSFNMNNNMLIFAIGQGYIQYGAYINDDESHIMFIEQQSAISCHERPHALRLSTVGDIINRIAEYKSGKQNQYFNPSMRIYQPRY